MKRVLTGVQSSGLPHLGNMLGAMGPAIEMSNSPKNEAFIFIADFHSLTTVRDGNLLRENTYATAAAWLAMGLDVEKNVFYRQSDVPEVAELAWFLNCLTPFPMLSNAHSFKDKSDRLADVNAGLFVYPVLMAADILLYDAEVVPVGKDQRQHLEMTRDIASAVNHKYGETFVLPEASISEEVMTIPGTDGQKMSKSYKNTINVFQSDKKMRKQVMSIITDSTPLEEPKDPDTCNVIKLYELVASAEQVEEMKNNYRAGNYGYGHAKQALYEAICEKYSEEREKYNFYIENTAEIDKKLSIGAGKAREIAQKVLKRARAKFGYSS